MKDNKPKWLQEDDDMDLIEALEKRFSLHDVDMIYNVLYEFLDIDTKQGEITFLDFINKKKKGSATTGQFYKKVKGYAGGS